MKILILDDEAVRHDAFDHVFGDKHHVDHAWTYWDVVGLLRDGNVKYDIAYLDHDLNDFPDQSQSLIVEPYATRELTGFDVARFIARQLDSSLRPQRVIIHSWNPDGAKQMLNILRQHGVQSTYEPFAFPKGFKVDQT